MSLSLSRIFAGLSVSALAVMVTQAALAQAAPSPRPAGNAEQETIELSPFTVSAESDDTWVATSSLAGSRLNTPLRDIGSSINVLTSEFLSDIGALDVSDAIGYSVNMHETVTREGSDNDNFALEFFDAGRMNIRGIPATATRNYFRWRMQTDNYNADRIEENRGPNSILFGIGSAGGVVNTLTKQASVNRDFRRASVSFGSFESYRATIDINQRLLARKLAVRLNAVHSDQNQYRAHMFNKTQRVHLAATYQPRATTRLRADFEIGDIKQVVGRGIPALDSVSNWMAAGSPIIQGPQAANSSLGIGRLATNATRITYIANTGEVYNYQGFNRTSGGVGGPILDQNLLSFKANPAGPGQTRNGDLKNLTLFWEERVGENTFVEFSHNLQRTNSVGMMTGQGTQENNQLYADPNALLPNGQLNPNAGRFMFEGFRFNRNIVEDKVHATRAMVSHELDFERWGNYRFAGMIEYEWRNFNRTNEVEAWEGRPFNNAPEHQTNQIHRRHYVTAGDWSTYYISGPGLGGLLTNIQDPTNPNRTLNSTWVNFNQGGQTDPIENQRTLMVGTQARYLKNRLILGLGVRQDKLETRTVQALRDPMTNEWTLDHPDIEPLVQKFNGTTRTLGVVGHVTRNLSAFYNYSNSLDLPNTNHRILPDGRPPPASDAQGHDFGIGLSFFDGRLSARANAFEVDLVNATGGGFGGSFSSPQVFNRRVLTGLLSAGVITQEIHDQRDFTQNQSIRNRKLEGYELNITGAITPNWNISINYSYTDGYDSEIAPEIRAWAADAIPWMMQWPDVKVFLAGEDHFTVADEVQRWQANAAQEWLREGDLILGNRKHKGSVFTRYSFDSGPLRGLFVGGGYRYQGKAPTNFIAGNVLAFSNSRGEADLLAGSTFRNVPYLKRGLKVQLNVRNLLDNRDPRITRYNPNGSINRVDIQTPRTWRLTANFDF